MPSTQFLQHVPHAPDCVMSLVTDVERYPDFVPAMSALRKTRDLPDGFEAEAVITFKGITETFASRVKIDPEDRTVVAAKLRKGGPVKSLENSWRFHAMSDGSTLVDFHVDVRLVFPLEALLRQKFEKAKTVVRDVFIEQAAEHCPPVGDGSKIDLVAEATRLGLVDRLV
ncbi:SRPBCC family protein [uncultured Algimonas sp.]|uniref:type II toxin-antitoxin system RatA family toxin n=1 Tax=uncultured Algimonas sp. TaxID=1547920 RepID=UPI00260CC542|nr:SRPBCC family protein [uncultured Algimonas sp.]